MSSLIRGECGLLPPALVAVGVVTAIGVAAVNRFRGTVANGGHAADTTVRMPNRVLSGSHLWPERRERIVCAGDQLAVRDPQQTPYRSASTDRQLSQVLSEQWPHDDILDSLP